MPRLEHIIAATDFSASANAAPRWAIRLAAEQQATLTLVHALEETAADEAVDVLREELRRSVAAAEDAVRVAGLEAETVFRTGNAHAVVDAVRRERDADLVVVGARGRSALASLFVGSTADRIVRTVSCPVLTVPPPAAGGDGGPDRSTAAPHRIVVATDFSDQAAAALDAADRIAAGGPAGGRLVLVHAWQPLVQYEMDAAIGITVNPLDDSPREAEALLEAIAEPLRSRGVEVVTSVRPGYPVSVIRQAVEASNATLVAMGTHGRRGLEHFMLGSVAERLLHHAPCPVLTVHHQ